MSQAFEGKVVLVGDTQVGKSSLVSKYNNLTNPLQQQNLNTVGVDTIQCTVAYNDETINLNVWDTAGQENFRCLVPVYARNSQVGLIVFDTSNKETFLNLEEWYNFLKQQADCTIILVANKSDLTPAVNNEEILKFTETHDNIEIYHTSAVTGDGVEILFQAIASVVDHKRKERKKATTINIQPTEDPNTNANKSCC